MNEFKPMPEVGEFQPMIKMFMDTATQVQSQLAYCDYIGNTIKHALPPTGVTTSSVQSDLHPTSKHLVSSKKTLQAEYLNKKYLITIEEIK